MSRRARVLARFRNILNRGGLRPVGTQIMAAAAALLVAALLLLGVNLSHLRDSYLTNERTDEVLLKISELDSRLQGAELSVRGYALTGNVIFVTYQKNEQRHVYVAFDHLDRLLADEPSQLKRLTAVRQLVQARIAWFSYLSSSPERAKNVAAAITDPKYRALMRRTRDALSGLSQAERRLLEAKQQDMTRQARRTFLIAACIVVWSFVLSALGLLLARGGSRH
jgi:CHASE3 domain sensor protein